jgi:hypothetical protein
VEDLSEDIDHRLSERLPVTPYVFIDPTQTASDDDDPGDVHQGAVGRSAARRRPATPDMTTRD